MMVCPELRALKPIGSAEYSFRDGDNVQAGKRLYVWYTFSIGSIYGV